MKEGRRLSEEELKEWQKSFSDIEESIKALYEEELKKNPKAKYKRMTQQDLFEPEN